MACHTLLIGSPPIQFPVDWSALDSDVRRKAWGSRGADDGASPNRLKHPYETGVYSKSSERVPAPAALLPRHYLSDHSGERHNRLVTRLLIIIYF
jgi:hypothetical protein